MIDFEIKLPEKKVITIDGIGIGAVNDINNLVFNESLTKSNMKGYQENNFLHMLMIDCVDKDFVIRISAKGSFIEEDLINGRRNKKRQTKMRVFKKLREYKTNHIIVKDISQPQFSCNEYVYDETRLKYVFVRFVELDENGNYDWNETFKTYDEFNKLCVESGVKYENTWLDFLKARYNIRG